MAWGSAACSVAAAAAAQRVARNVVCNQLAFSARCRSWAGGARAGHTCSPVPCLVLRTFQRLCLPRPGPVLRAAGAGDAGVWPAGCAGQRGAANQPALPAAGIQQHGAGGCAGAGRLQRLPTPSVAAVRAVHTAGPPPRWAGLQPRCYHSPWRRPPWAQGALTSCPARGADASRSTFCRLNLTAACSSRLLARLQRPCIPDGPYLTGLRVLAMSDASGFQVGGPAWRAPAAPAARHPAALRRQHSP